MDYMIRAEQNDREKTMQKLQVSVTEVLRQQTQRGLKRFHLGMRANHAATSVQEQHNPLLFSSASSRLSLHR